VDGLVEANVAESVLSQFSGLKVEDSNQSTWCLNSKEHHHNRHRRENIKSYSFKFCFIVVMSCMCYWSADSEFFAHDPAFQNSSA
jgi:hypothetical protein